MNDKNDYIKAVHQIIISLGLPRAQQNKRSALCLLALLNLTPGKAWGDAENPLIGITPIMDWAREHYDKDYAQQLTLSLSLREISTCGNDQTSASLLRLPRITPPFFAALPRRK